MILCLNFFDLFLKSAFLSSLLFALKLVSNTKTICVTGFDNTGSVVALVKTTGRCVCNITENQLLQMFFAGRFSEMPSECIDEYTVRLPLAVFRVASAFACCIMGAVVSPDTKLIRWRI